MFFPPLSSVETDLCRVQLAGLQAGRQYLLRVRATNARGSGAWSEVAAAWTALAPPPAPAGPSFSHRTATSLRAKWDAPDDDHGAPVVHYRRGPIHPAGYVHETVIAHWPSLGELVRRAESSPGSPLPAGPLLRNSSAILDIKCKHCCGTYALSPVTAPFHSSVTPCDPAAHHSSGVRCTAHEPPLTGPLPPLCC